MSGAGEAGARDTPAGGALQQAREGIPRARRAAGAQGAEPAAGERRRAPCGVRRGKRRVFRLELCQSREADRVLSRLCRRTSAG